MKSRVTTISKHDIEQAQHIINALKYGPATRDKLIEDMQIEPAIFDRYIIVARRQ